jgi:hypothetical protein
MRDYRPISFIEARKKGTMVRHHVRAEREGGNDHGDKATVIKRGGVIGCVLSTLLLPLNKVHHSYEQHSRRNLGGCDVFCL